MARFRKIDPRIWKDERFIHLQPEEKLVALYCLTCTQSNRIGIFNFSPAMAAEDLGTLPPTFAKRFDNVCHTLNWLFDSTHKVLYFPNWWKYNRPDNPNSFQSCLADLDELPQSPLVKEFCGNSRYLPDKFFQRLVNVTPNVTPYVPPSGEGEGTGEGEGKRAGDNTPPNPQGGSDLFEQFWEVFPRLRKSGPAAAREAWKKAIRKAEPTAIIEAAREYAASPVGQGQYVKGPTPWLNQECWNDDRAAWQRSENGTAKTDLFSGQKEFLADETNF